MSEQAGRSLVGTCSLLPSPASLFSRCHTIEPGSRVIARRRARAHAGASPMTLQTRRTESRWLTKVILGLVLSLACVPGASAQYRALNDTGTIASTAGSPDGDVPPTQIDLGTYSVGQVWAQLFGPDRWAVAAGSTLPPGLSLRTDTPPWFPPDAHAGIIGLATTAGDYTFTLTRGLSSPQPYRIRISRLTARDWWTLKDAFV